MVGSQLLPDWAVLDGQLLLSVPPHVTAATGIDAMVHAIEASTATQPPHHQLLHTHHLLLVPPEHSPVNTSSAPPMLRACTSISSAFSLSFGSNTNIIQAHALHCLLLICKRYFVAPVAAVNYVHLMSHCIHFDAAV